MTVRGQAACYYCGKPMLAITGIDWGEPSEPPEPITTAEEKPVAESTVCADCNEVVCECHDQVWGQFQLGYGWNPSERCDGRAPDCSSISTRRAILERLKRDGRDENWSARRIPKETTK
jgi:hypothetical protein